MQVVSCFEIYTKLGQAVLDDGVCVNKEVAGVVIVLITVGAWKLQWLYSL
jgi:hypothetical protein